MTTATLGNFSKLSNPYLAQLPVGFYTGLAKQFIPRISSTVKWENISRESMTTDCEEIPGSFYSHYANATWPPENPVDLIRVAPKNWSIQACMPGTQNLSPWRETFHKQSFTEVLYLNIFVMGYDDYYGYPKEGLDSPITGGTFRITSETTAGYFELPNYMNGGQAGAILDSSPNDEDNCGFDCPSQIRRRDTSGSQAIPTVSNVLSHGSLEWDDSVTHRGPLMIVATALFGHGSFIPARLDNPESFIQKRPWVDVGSDCVDQQPLESLLRRPAEVSSYSCIRDDIQSPERLDRQIAGFIQSFYLYDSRESTLLPSERSENAFASAVFLATEACLTSDSSDARRQVTSDPGADTVIPAMSRAAMILISSLWAVYITCLLSLAVYSARIPRWTGQLDSFAMMRIGAAVNDRVSLDVSFEMTAIDALDEIPGLIGDATGGDGDVGSLGMGASTPLNGIRRYKCYEADEKKARERAIRYQDHVRKTS